MAKKKHIAIQDSFPFVEEVTVPVQNAAPHDNITSTKLSDTVKEMNSTGVNGVNGVNGETGISESFVSQTNVTGDQTSLSQEVVNNPPNYATVAPTKKNTPPIEISRNKYGLYNHIDYVFNEDGFVNWRAMIPQKYLYVGKNIKDNPVKREIFEKKYGKKPEKVDLAVDKIEDEDLLITLGGIRYLALLRGYNGVSFNVLPNAHNAYASVTCDIQWIDNYEVSSRTLFGGIKFSGAACATLENTYSFSRNYLPEIASNRAFCRAVRNFLNIDVVSDEEAFEKKLDESTLPPSTSTGSTPYGQPHELLKAKMAEKNIEFAQVKAQMVKRFEANNIKGDDYEAWKKAESVLDLTPLQIFDVIGRMNKKDKEKQKETAGEKE